MWKRAFLGIALALALAALWLVAAFRRDMNVAYERIAGRTAVLPSRHGDIEYLQGGTGPDVLVIHGGGGGWDQGQLLAQTVLGDRFHWVAPSRFGYLGSTLLEGATWDDQAHAYATLLDHLKIRRAAVVAMSQGGPSALLFAVLHPTRVSSLSCLSCGVAPAASNDQEAANRKGDWLKRIFQFDLPYWAFTRFFRTQFLSLMGVNPDVINALQAEQFGIADEFVDRMNPASLRSAGAAFDNRATLPGQRIDTIKAPTLIVHATDDTLQLYRNAEFAVSRIEGARLLSFERGGHLVVVVEQKRVRRVVQEHVLQNQE